jgi:hypothetical protein
MKSVRKQWVLDVQWSDCPKDVEEEVKKIWRDDDRLSNDVCISKYYDEDWTWDSRNSDFDEENHTQSDTRYPAIEKWLLKNGVPFGEEVWIHWWW